MKKYYPVDFDEKGNAVLGNAKSNPTSNGFIPTTWAPGGGSEDEGKQGLKSISISPAITTTTALDSLFPIYWDDLPEGVVEEGVEYRYYETTLHTGYDLTNGTEYTISATPTSDWRVYHYGTGGDIGEAITFTATVYHGSLIIESDAIDAAGTECVHASITITE